jgi:hypothetical protein
MLFRKKVVPTYAEPIDIDITRVSKEFLLFVHKEAAVRVQDTVKDHSEIVKKATSLLVFSITLSTIVFGYLIKQYSEDEKDPILLSISIVALIELLMIIIWLIRILYAVDFRAPGREPANIMKKSVEAEDKHHELQYKNIIYVEIKHCQAQIDFNQAHNTSRLKSIDQLLWFVVISLVLLTAFLFGLKAV